MIYFDHAATSLYKPDCVAVAVTNALKHFGNPGRGAHGASLDASRMVYQVRRRIAKFFGADGPEQVVFTANATQSLNMVIQGLFTNRDHVITTAMEHNSVLRPLYLLERQGMGLTVVSADQTGMISYAEMEAAVRVHTRAIICTHASNVTGNLTDLEKVADICARHRLLLIVDASQTAGIFPINMRIQGIDVLCFTGHKGLMGPQGIGGMCIRSGLCIRPLLYGGSGIQSYSKFPPDCMPEALEAGTLNGPGIAGLGAAIEYIEQTGINWIQQEEQKLAAYFFKTIKSIPRIRFYGDFSPAVRAPIISLNIGSRDAGAVADELFQRYEIAVRAGAHCAPRIHEAMGTAGSGTVRFSFSSMNTYQEVQTAAAAVILLAEEDG